MRFLGLLLAVDSGTYATTRLSTPLCITGTVLASLKAKAPIEDRDDADPTLRCRGGGEVVRECTYTLPLMEALRGPAARMQEEAGSNPVKVDDALKVPSVGAISGLAIAMGSGDGVLVAVSLPLLLVRWRGRGRITGPSAVIGGRAAVVVVAKMSPLWLFRCCRCGGGDTDVACGVAPSLSVVTEPKPTGVWLSETSPLKAVRQQGGG